MGKIFWCVNLKENIRISNDSLLKCLVSVKSALTQVVAWHQTFSHVYEKKVPSRRIVWTDRTKGLGITRFYAFCFNSSQHFSYFSLAPTSRCLTPLVTPSSLSHTSVVSRTSMGSTPPSQTPPSRGSPATTRASRHLHPPRCQIILPSTACHSHHGRSLKRW